MLPRHQYSNPDQNNLSSCIFSHFNNPSIPDFTLKVNSKRQKKALRRGLIFERVGLVHIKDSVA